jgi:NIPSNAP
MKTSASLVKAILLMFLISVAGLTKATEPPICYYQLKIYHYKTKSQEDRLDNYLKNAYMPADMRAGGWEVGVFKTLEQDTADKRIYVLSTFRRYGILQKLDKRLMKDKQYLTDAKDFLDAPYNDAPYTRFETIILRAFPRWPISARPQLTANNIDRIYELRSYESPTEKYHVSKVKMFNRGGETLLFSRLRFNAVFYADVLIGSHMPNLMYMTAFENKADRDKHWDTFSNDPEWKTLSAMPEYQHNVSKAEIIFLHPTEYSQL